MEIDGVCEVDGKGNTVDDDKDPLAYLVIDIVLFQMQREEHHNDIEHIRIDNGRGIKQQASPEDIKGIGEIFPILHEILQTCYLID